VAKILVHNPSAPEVSTRTAVSALAAIRESRAGVLSNGKQHAELVMSEIARRLGDRYGVIHTYTGHKPVAGPAEPAVVEELVSSCDWVLVGSAD
jgi:hypothetical protein